MPPAAIAGASLVSTLASKKKSSSSLPVGTPAAYDVQADLAKQLFDQTSPIRQGLIDRSSAFLNGGLDASPQFSALKANIEPQYNIARDNIIGDTPSGGALTSALTNLEAARAHDLTQGASDVYNSELARAMNLATGGTGESLSALGNAGSIQAQLAAAEAARKAQQNSAALGAIGTGVGGWLGSKG